MPAELHLHFLLAIVATMGLAKGYMSRQSLVQQQCSSRRQSLPPTIPHFQLSQVNYRMVLPDVSIRLALVTLTVLLLLTVLLTMAWAMENRKCRRRRGSSCA